MRVFYLAQIGKYLPGAVWPFVAQMELGKALGVPRQRSAVAGLLFVGLHCATGLLVASATLPFASPAAAEHYWWVLALTPVLLVVLHPRVLALVDAFWLYGTEASEARMGGDVGLSLRASDIVNFQASFGVQGTPDGVEPRVLVGASVGS